MQCIRCDQPADREVTWPFNGVTEPYCGGCIQDYHAGADEVDAHEARIGAEGWPASHCPRPTERMLTEK